MNKPDQVSKKANIIITILTVVILLMTAVFVIWLLQGSKAKPSYTFEGSIMTISGQFGKDIDLSGAAVTQETTQLPAIETRTNGAAIGNILKGQFKMNGQSVYLNVMDKTASGYILITAADGSLYYINCETPIETAALYQEVLVHITK
ncbi:MAG TPA: hypothetical protein PK629_11455 [Oscillospiraceae bacterium]|nr:hypothetical protein [Oscillospiraceae bacterium]HPK35950.1 hypothetical protein [Oscillospiraceae bacterium]HPR75643.1 hypothetical protein [Oscillospiraceae bacterium]